MPEAKLAREAELPFATLALSTDYDCWHSAEEAVTVEAVVATLKKNVSSARATAKALAGMLPDLAKSPARTALAGAVMTDLAVASADAKAKLSWLLP
jgi:5'-methylthioadenosine phosphorylase